MKIAACVVLYNPLDECLKNIRSYLSIADVIYVLDNSTAYNFQLIERLKIEENVIYINLNGNQGIACALKTGVEKAIASGFDLSLTMDQDSIFPEISREKLEERFAEIDLDDYGIVGLNFNAHVEEKKLIETTTIITSGNFINLKNYKNIKGFREELFIDYVDFDLDEQFYEIGKKVAYWQDLSLIHQIGNPQTHRFQGFKFTVMNHAPIRYYYRFRNARYLYRKHKKFYKKLYYHDLLIDIPKIILFEKQKRLKLMLIRKGRKDAKAGKMGGFENR